MSGKPVVNQHFVPQGHMRLFADDNERFWVYDKATDRVFGAAIRDIAAERYFNEYLPDQAEHFQKGEAFFQKVEDLGLPIMRDAVQRALATTKYSPDIVLSNRERSTLAYYLAVQMQRTKESREEARELLNKLGTQLARKLAPPPPKGFTLEQLVNVKFKDDYVRFAHLQSVARQAEPLSKLLFEMIWLFGVNKTAQDLWLSDHPVVREAVIKQKRSSGRGLLSPGVQVHFPISPKLELLICDPAFYEEAKILDGTVIETTEDDVRRSNLVQVEHAYRFIFGCTSNFEAARELCSNNPSLRQCNKERFDDEWLNKDRFVERVLGQQKHKASRPLE